MRTKTHSGHRLTRNIIGAMLAFATAGCDRGELRELPSEPEADGITLERPLEFRHKFANVPLENGKIPVIEAKNAPDGRRYAFMDRAGGEASNGVSDSVLMKLERRQLSAQERAARKALKTPRPPKSQRPIVDPPVELALQQGAVVEVAVRFAEPDRIDIKRELNRLVALGHVTSWAQYTQEKDRLKALDRREIATVLDPLLAQARSRGVNITYQCKAMYCAIATVDAASLHELASIPGVKKVDLIGSNATNQTTDGIHVFEGMQYEQFLPENGGSLNKDGEQAHDGENWPSTRDLVDMRIALIDANFPEVDHPGFKEGTGSSDRIDSHIECTTNPCTTVSNPSESQEGSHATEMLGTAIGDVRDEQEGPPDVPDGLDPEQQRSGYSGEAKAWVYRAGTSQAAAIRAADHLIAATGTTVPWLVHQPIGATTDTDCSGDHSADDVVNDLFEDGKTFVFAAGNNTGSSTNCVVEQPGSAIGSLTVGYTGSSSDSDTTDVRQATIGTFSDWGGNATEGDNRSIIDLVPYGCRKFLFDTTWGYTSNACSTSQASAAAAGGILNYVDWYINRATWTDIREEPGFVQANALLMGDRRQGSNSFMTVKYHHRYGAGTIEARRFEGPYMDGPWGFGSGDVCVDDGEEVVISINGGSTLSSDIEDFKAVAWWYDARHGDGTQIDDIDLELYKTNGTRLVSSLDSSDEKERLYSTVAGGSAVELRIVGEDVTADNVGPCGTNSMEVYYAYFYEDDDRDDSDGPPNSEIEREGHW